MFETSFAYLRAIKLNYMKLTIFNYFDLQKCQFHMVQLRVLVFGPIQSFLGKVT